MLRTPSVLLLLSGLLLPLACTDAGGDTPDTDDAGTTTEVGSGSGSADGAASTTAAAEDPTFTYYRDAKAIIDRKCGSCHRPGDIAPFSLQTYEEVQAVAAVLPSSLETQSMPPWPPAAGCRDYEHSRALSEAEQALLLTWLDEGAPAGDPADAPGDPGAPDDWAPTMSIEMAEPYTPTVEPDENRCFLVPWPEVEAAYITGFRVIPGNRSIVHHMIMFNADADAVAELEALDDADPAPGYECFGGVGGRANWVGAWVPGANDDTLPAGTGIGIEPGSMMVLQLHYNTLSSAPAPDQTRVELMLAPEVERPAVTVPFTKFQWVTGGEPMVIPAGDPSVTHSVDMPANNPILRQIMGDLGLGADDGFVVHGSGLHMHYLGTAASISVVRSGGSEDCMLEIPEWDFAWQGGYTLREPLRVGPDDSLRLSCTWDNSAENQHSVNGELLEPQSVQWGEGTTDEMCLGVLYVTAE
jgi:Copper type II ascorbate-dependent monooxygenase, N-terminal domain/Copper type II ascorbate-dependent monooxygenase, C-terminal domain